MKFVQLLKLTKSMTEIEQEAAEIAVKEYIVEQDMGIGEDELVISAQTANAP